MKTNSKKIVANSHSKQELHSTNKNNNIALVRSHSISHLFSQNKTILNYLGQRLQRNHNANQDDISTRTPCSSVNQEQYSKFSFNKYSQYKARTKQCYRATANIINKRNGFLESSKTPTHKIKKELPCENANCLKIENNQLRKEINSYKAILEQITDKNKRTFPNGINLLSSYDNIIE